ncbi:Alpha-(1 3)-fucosyltransferase 7 [Mactra antiquata]
MPIRKLQSLLSRSFIYKLCIALLVLLVFHLMTYYFLNISSELHTNPNSHGVRYVRLGDKNSTLNLKKKRPKILYWESFDNIDGAVECMKHCAYKCDVTKDVKEIETADAVLFHLMNIWSDNWSVGTKKTVAFPTYRRPDQVWVMFNLEPPSNLFGDVHIFNGVFNWTIWYRKDATIYHPYGSFRALDENEAKMAELEFKDRNFFKEKTKNISGMISNCKDSGQRYRLVDELSRYIKIDMFGKCYNKQCGDYTKPQTCDYITKSYKFYLGLENSQCKDYVTEKYWSTLEREQIPIVNWDYNNIDESIPIPGSFVSINDFKSLKELAEYVEKVNNDETLYNSYFNWKKKYKITYMCNACVACEALHKPIQPQVIEDFAGWVNNDVCDKVNKFNIWKVKLNEFLFWKLGI